MSVKLTERVRVKRILRLADMDLLYDDQFDDLIQQVSAEVEQICRRSFSYNAARVEYYPSYEQNPFDPDPQYIWLDGPLDPDIVPVIVWAAYDQHDLNGITLVPPTLPTPITGADWRYDFTTTAGQDAPLIIVKSSTGSVANMPIPAGVGLPVYSYSATGFRVTYGAGYPVTVPPDPYVPDPSDDYGVTQVPSGLKNVIARKIASDWKQYNTAMPWGDKERVWLRPWMKKNLII